MARRAALKSTFKPAPWDNETDIGGLEIPGFHDASQALMVDDPLELPKCLRDFLRPYFANVVVDGKSYSPVDDARFIPGIPGGVSNPAMTLGLYDVHYDPAQVDLTGGQDKSSIGTISEEIAHTAQFLNKWETIREPDDRKAGTQRRATYLEAQNEWAVSYLAASVPVAAGNAVKAIGLPVGYGSLHDDNPFEKDAMIIRRRVENDIKGLSKSPCYP